jgi:ribosome recycling factor
MYLDDFREKAQKIIDHLKDELRAIRTGRAQPSLIENLTVMVTAYGGAPMQLRELASITAPDASLLTVQAYDPNVIRDIEKAIQISNLGLNPVVDQQLIRLALPPLTEERRVQLAKLVDQKIEETRVAIRSQRSDTKKDIEGQKDEAGISEDDISRERDELQKVVEEFNVVIDQIGEEKKAELKQV